VHYGRYATGVGNAKKDGEQGQKFEEDKRTFGENVTRLNP
jgi:hypothetical protein